MFSLVLNYTYLAHVLGRGKQLVTALYMFLLLIQFLYVFCHVIPESHGYMIKHCFIHPEYSKFLSDHSNKRKVGSIVLK